MSKLSVGLDATMASMVAQLTSQIGEFEARGWLMAAAKAEELVCAVYDEAGVAVPEERAEGIASTLAIDLQPGGPH
jgi:hypothetical protein